MLGREGVLKLVGATDTSDPAGIIPELLRQVTSMSEGNLHGDDVTIMLVKPNGASVPVHDDLLAPFRYISDLIGLAQ
jgi:hypothetical protein